MAFDLKSRVDSIFNSKEEKEEKSAFKDKIDSAYGKTEIYNPFVKKDGSLVNPYINYQNLLDSSRTSDRVKSLITQATGLSPTAKPVFSGANVNPVVTPQTTEKSVFKPVSNPKNLATLDVTTELPKLDVSQIKAIISAHFSKSTVIKPEDAEGIYNAQQKTGMSALAILGIGALESGYGTSNIAQKKNNIWGWGAVNSDTMGQAKTFSAMSEGALQFATAYMNTYYNKYGATSIYSAGTGNNPAQKGYAYNDDGTISTTWADSVGSIMQKFYNTALSGTTTTVQSQEVVTGDFSDKVGKRIANTAAYNNSAAKGQCVWYVRGRVQEKLGKTMGSHGHANEMWYNAKSSAKVKASVDNIRPNMIVSYKYGTSSAGQTYGHVIYIEDVVGDTVYYTEGGSGYYKNGTDGVVKTATRQGILDGVNTSGKRMGSNIIGLIDVTKY